MIKTMKLTSGWESDKMTLAFLSEMNSMDGSPAPAAKGAKTQIEQVYQRLRKDIITGTLAPGSKLPVEHLRGLYGAGASTLREALTLLVADALVTAEGQRGFRVAPISLDDFREVTRLRALMETLALREAIERGDDRWEAGIVAAFHRLGRVEERMSEEPELIADDWEERNREFHEALIAACASKWVHHFRDILYRQSERYRRQAFTAPTARRDVHVEHQQIMEAALDRNADRACALTEEHMTRTLTALLHLMRNNGVAAS